MARKQAAATVAADPPDDPPGVCSWFHGFFVEKKAEFSVEEPIANSSKFNFPVQIMSALINFCAAVAVNGEM